MSVLTRGEIPGVECLPAECFSDATLGWDLYDAGSLESNVLMLMVLLDSME